MKIATTIYPSGNSRMIRIPPGFVEYYGLKNGNKKCKIEDINEHEFKIIIE